MLLFQSCVRGFKDAVGRAYNDVCGKNRGRRDKGDNGGGMKR